MADGPVHTREVVGSSPAPATLLHGQKKKRAASAYFLFHTTCPWSFLFEHDRRDLRMVLQYTRLPRFTEARKEILYGF